MGAFCINSAKKILIALGMLLLASAPSYAAVQIQGGAPSGFEALESPRPTVVTLYYGGELLGTFAAHYTPTTLQFDKPDDFVSQIPAIKDKAKVIAALSRPIGNNLPLLCTQKRTENCGILAPDVAGVIYDEDHLSAELFINKDNLSIVNANGTRYLPLPERKFSSVYSFEGALAGGGGDAPNFSLTGNNIYSMGEANLTTESTLSNDGLRFDTAAASVDRNGYNGTAGLFRSRAMQLVSDIDIAGVSVATSNRTVIDQHKSEGNDIIVYLPRRAFVSLYRDSHLYSSRTYDAGNQHIDTSELPDGAYTVTLRIQEADGQTREEKRFFAKAQEIPPPGQPVYYAQAGVVRQPPSQDSTIPQLTSLPLLRFGMTRRVADNSALTISAIGLNDRMAAEGGAVWMNATTLMRGTVMASTKGDIGVQGMIQETMDKFNGVIDFRRSWTQSAPDIDYQGILSSIQQATASLNYNYSESVTFGLRGNYTGEDALPATISFGPYAEWRIWQKGESTLALNGDVARTQGENQGDVLMRFTYRFGDNGVTGTAGSTFDQKGPSGVGNLRVWHDQKTSDGQYQVGGGVATQGATKIASADGDWRNHFGQIHGTVQEASMAGDSTLSYGGNFSFGAAQAGSDVIVGGDQNDRSAVIIRATGDNQAGMKVFINGSERTTMKVGEERVIYLTPFHSYNISIEPAQKSLLDYDNNNRKVTLYPGNVVPMSWDVRTFYVVVARIIHPDGTPLRNETLKESRAQVTTDDRGHVQAELPKIAQLTFTANDGASCVAALPQDIKAINGVLIYTRDIICR